jgi:hypothetical protein
MMLEMVAWSAKYDPQTAAPRAFVKRIAKDRADVLAELKATYDYRRAVSTPLRRVIV